MSAIEDLYIICVHQDETLSQPRLRLSLGVLMRCSITRLEIEAQTYKRVATLWKRIIPWSNKRDGVCIASKRFRPGVWLTRVGLERGKSTR